MVVALTLFDSTTLTGLLSPALFLLAIAFGAWAYARVHISKAQDQAITTWRQNAEALEERAEIAQVRYEEQRGLKHAALAELAAEKMKTDQTVVRTSLKAMEVQMKGMEERLVEVLAGQTEVLREVAKAVIKSNGH